MTPFRINFFNDIFRFTAAIGNIGSADFRPFIPKTAWNWHACHQVYPRLEFQGASRPSPF